MSVSVFKPLPEESRMAEYGVRVLAATLSLVRYNHLPAMWGLPGLRRLREAEKAPPNGEHVPGETPPAPVDSALQEPEEP